MIEVKIPSPGESITQVQLANWLVGEGSYVEKDQEIAEIDSDKATLSIPAPEAGTIHFAVSVGDTIAVGAVLCHIDETAAVPDKPGPEPFSGKVRTPAPAQATTEPAAPAPPVPLKSQPTHKSDSLHISPLARQLMAEKGMEEEEIISILKSVRISRSDVEKLATLKNMEVLPAAPSTGRDTERKKMSTLRIKLSERLVAVKNQTAMLTTFNEVNLAKVLELKSKFNEPFKEKYGFGFGLMSFFTRACCIALGDIPAVNARIDGEDIIYHHFVDMGIAVSAPKGLVVPVIRNADSLSISEIEAKIKELANKARNNKITLEEMSGGTFTISNGGVFGSMMSTPILNPPQSGILGMHNIIDRPVAVNGEVKIQPMMYIALSYDHRIIDGRESVTFLVRVKELLEDPMRLLTGGNDPAKALLGID